MGEPAGEEHSDPERRSLGMSRLLSMASRAADFLRGRGLGVLASILMGYPFRRVVWVGMVFEDCTGDANAFYAL